MVGEGSTPIEMQPEPPRLRFLRWLVIGLTVTMIVGLLVIIALMIMTFMGAQERRSKSDLPTIVDNFVLPDGQSARAYTQGTGWSAVVTRDQGGVERILIFDPKSGDIRQTVEIQ